ncbi:fumarylacetoacetate hydrolase family protein [Actinoplanes subtropicus]|uniref:fumarylacetoacetate hydrolase family protein n=1 Tax=Actinoplanes subtropicus TaxID=543632 RepID=UPI0004C3752F|nr:fumarylacetoacetate hydrolase family protein [Actinoplanes subtropicus]
MRLARFDDGGRPRAGVVVADRLLPLPEETDVLQMLTAPAQQRRRLIAEAERAGQVIPLSEVTLRTPFAPRSFRDFVCFEQHVEGMAKLGDPGATVMPQWYEAPHFYFTNHAAMHDPGQAIAIPPGCELLDFELEIAVVVGRAGRDLTVAQARDHIAGFMIYNDWSARDLAVREARLGLGFAKAKDFANVIGPWIVSPDELEPYRRGDRIAIELVASRNGEEIGRDSLANMAWSFEEMLAYASRGTWLYPGDVLGSGTCGGGCLAELWGRNGRLEPRPCRAGDEVTLSAEGIGTLTNTVVAGTEPVSLPRARARLEGV